MQAHVRLQVIEEMLASSPPGVAGLVLHSLTRWVSQSWPQDGEKPNLFHHIYLLKSLGSVVQASKQASRQARKQSSIFAGQPDQLPILMQKLMNLPYSVSVNVQLSRPTIP